MSPPRPAVIDDVEAALAPVGTVSARAMFGGHGLYLDGTIFTIVVAEDLYFRAYRGQWDPILGSH